MQSLLQWFPYMLLYTMIPWATKNSDSQKTLQLLESRNESSSTVCLLIKNAFHAPALHGGQSHAHPQTTNTLTGSHEIIICRRRRQSHNGQTYYYEKEKSHCNGAYGKGTGHIPKMV